LFTGTPTLFGEVIKEEMAINQIGKIVNDQWFQLPGRFNGIQLGAFVVMPNHIHGIISIEKSTSGQTIGKMIGAYKSLAANDD
jgi:REP element-mobilizing transposase RayT